MEAIVEKLKTIESIEEMDKEEIAACVESGDILVRCDTAAALAKFVSVGWVAEIIVKMLSDGNYLVRCEACEALDSLPVKTETILDELLKVMRSDRSSTVRMYAVSTLALWIKDSLPWDDDLNKRVFGYCEKETSKRVLVSYAVLFYTVTADLKHIDTLLDYLDDEDYHIRHNVINGIDDIVDKNNVAAILQKYKQRAKGETAYSVLTSLKSRIAEYGRA